MSKRIVSDSTGLYKLNIVNKEKNSQDSATGRNSIEKKELENEKPSSQPQSPRRAALKINIANDLKEPEETEDEIITKIAQVEDEILQCESKLSSLKEELKILQAKLQPVVKQAESVPESRRSSRSDFRSKVRSISPQKSVPGSPTSKWKLFKENGSSLLKKFKEFTIDDEDEQEYDDLMAKNKNSGIHHFTVKNGLNYNYDTDSESGDETDDKSSEED